MAKKKQTANDGKTGEAFIHLTYDRATGKTHGDCQGTKEELAFLIFTMCKRDNMLMVVREGLRAHMGSLVAMAVNEVNEAISKSIQKSKTKKSNGKQQRKALPVRSTVAPNRKGSKRRSEK